MAYPQGAIPVTGAIGTTSITDVYATHINTLGNGGLHNVSGLTGRNNITVERRSWGMQASVYGDPTISNNITYILADATSGGVTNNLSDNNNWITYYNAGTITGATNNGGGYNIYNNTVNKTLQFYTLSGGTNVNLTQFGNTLLINSTLTISGGSASGLTSLNGLVASSQNFSQGVAGSDFAIISAGNTHTFNIPFASNTNTGKLSSTDWNVFNNKLNKSDFDGYSSNTLTNINSRLIKSEFDNYSSSTNTRIGIVESQYLSGATNQGNGFGLYNNTTNKNLNFNTLSGGTNITLSQVGNIIKVDSPNTITNATNIGGGNNIFNTKIGDVLQFFTLSGGTNVSLTQFGNTLLINSTLTISGGSASGLTALNGLVASSQSFNQGVAGADFNIVSAGSVHTFNIPIATTLNTGKLSATDWNTFNNKIDGGGVANQVTYWNGTKVITGNTNFIYSNNELSLIDQTTNTNNKGLSVSQNNSGIQGGLLSFKKSRGTFSSPSNINPGDLIGLLSFKSYKSGAYTIDRTYIGSAINQANEQDVFIGNSIINNDAIPVFRVTSNKKITIGDFGDYNINTLVDGNAKLHIKPTTNAEIITIIQGLASQTSDLSQWQNISNNVLLSINSGGTLSLFNQNQVRYFDNDNSNFISIRSPFNIPSNYIITLPSASPISNQYLGFDGTNYNWNTLIGASGTITGATNVGNGFGVFSNILNNNLQFKSISGGTNILITQSGNTLNINADLSSKLNVSDFNIYSSNTLNNINTRLIKSEFDNYSAFTNSRIITVENQYLSGATNQGNGFNLYNNTTNKNLNFNTLSGGTSINLSQIGNIIKIDSTFNTNLNTTQVGFGNITNNLTGETTFVYNSSQKRIKIGSGTYTEYGLDVVNPNGSSVIYTEAQGSGSRYAGYEAIIPTTSSSAAYMSLGTGGSNAIDLQYYGSTTSATSLGINLSNTGILFTRNNRNLIIVSSGIGGTGIITFGVGGNAAGQVFNVSNGGVTVLNNQSIRFNNGANSFYTSLKTGNNLANLNLTLPIADGTSGQVLSTNGSGVLSFIPMSPGGLTGVTLTNKRIAFGSTANTLTESSDLTWDDSTKTLELNNAFRVKWDDDYENLNIGKNSLINNVNGYYNLSIGLDNLRYNTDGYYNTSIGFEALKNNTIGYENIALGVGALEGNISGYSNIAIGDGSLDTNTIGSFNIAIGLQARSSTIDASNELLFGGEGYPIHKVYVGMGGFYNASGFAQPDVNFYLTPSNGLDQSGGSYIINGGQSTGSGLGGSVILATSPASGTSSNEVNQPIQRVVVDQLGHLTLNGQKEFRFNNSANTFYTSLKTGNNLANLNLTLPIVDGTNGQVLSTNGSGVLSFVPMSSGGLTGVTLTNKRIAFGSTTNSLTESADLTWDDTTKTLMLNDGFGIKWDDLGYNLGIGKNNFTNNISGGQSIAIGSYIMENNEGSANIGIGNFVLQNNVSGYFNTAFGTYSLLNNTTGNNNTAIGVAALSPNTTGNNNTAIGVSSLANNSSGDYNIGIGYGSKKNTNGASNEFVVGSEYAPIYRSYFGSGGQTTSGLYSQPDVNFYLTPSNGLDFNGGNYIINGGQSTGSGVGGSVILATSPASTSSSVVNTPIQRLIVDQLGHLTLNGQKELRFNNSANTFYTSLKTGNNTSNLSLTLPIVDGSNGQVLSTNGSGVLSFISMSGGTSGANIPRNLSTQYNTVTNSGTNENSLYVANTGSKSSLSSVYNKLGATISGEHGALVTTTSSAGSLVYRIRIGNTLSAGILTNLTNVFQSQAWVLPNNLTNNSLTMNWTVITKTIGSSGTVIVMLNTFLDGYAAGCFVGPVSGSVDLTSTNLTIEVSTQFSDNGNSIDWLTSNVNLKN